MQPIEIIVIVASVLIVGGVVVWALVRKKRGKSDCNCCGGCCGSCNGCSRQQKTDTEREPDK